MTTISVSSYQFNNPVGYLGIAEMNKKITRVLFNCKEEDLSDISLNRLFFSDINYYSRTVNVCKTDLLNLAATQIREYLNGQRAVFDLPLQIEGAYFTKIVYHELLKIPAGQTRSYKEVAIASGNPKASRAVGMINKNNPLPIFVPCHRVIGSTGNLIGYAGGIPMKQHLLDMEKVYYTS